MQTAGGEAQKSSDTLSMPPPPLGLSGSSSSQHRRKPEIVLHKGHASLRITSAPPVQGIAATGYRGTSLMRNQTPLGPSSRTMPRVVWQP